MATQIVKDTELHQSHRTLVLNNKPSWSNTNKKLHLFYKHEIKHNTSTPYKHIQFHKQTNNLGHPVTQKQNTTQWTRIIQDNDKPDYSSGRQTTTHTQQSRIPFFSHIRDIRHTITNLPHQKGSNCFKKKNTRERESEGDGCTNMRPQPPRGQSRINYHRKKEGERAEIRQLRIEE